MNPSINWFDNPEHWVDGTDIARLGKQAHEVLRDLIVNRHTEYNRFRYLFLRSLKNGVALTRRQRKAWEYAQEAQRLGITESNYISEKMGMHRDNAKRLLNRAEERMYFITYQNEIKIVGFDDSMAIYNNTHTTITISQDDVDNVVKGRWVDCPTNGIVDTCTGRAPARMGLCRSCYDYYTEHPKGFPKWVKEIAKDIRREERRKAKEYLFQQRHGVNMDISDIN